MSSSNNINISNSNSSSKDLSSTAKIKQGSMLFSVISEQQLDEMEENLTAVTKKNMEIHKKVEEIGKKLKELKILVDRKALLSVVLEKALQKQELTQAQMSSMITYLEKAGSAKLSMSDCCNPKSLFYSIQKTRLDLPDTAGYPNLWKELTRVGLEIDAQEELLTVQQHGADYNKLKQEFSELLLARAKSDQDFSMLTEKFLVLFQPQNIPDAQTLQNACEHADHKKTELMLLCEELDTDLASVIKKRAKECVAKGNTLVTMTFQQFSEVMQSKPKIDGVTKLSFLHHYSSLDKRDLGYANSSLAAYLENLPKLKEIVLRGCGTASDAEKAAEPVYSVKKVVDPYEKQTAIQGATQLVVQQKEIPGEGIQTKVSWMERQEGGRSLIRREIKDIDNVSIIKGKFLSDEQLKALERHPQMPLLKHSNAYVNQTRIQFYDENKKMSAEDLASAKKVLPRARTLTINGKEQASSDDLQSRVLSFMTAEQKDRISLKAYIGGYSVAQSRVVPMADHDQGNKPKALRVGPKPT